VLASGASAPSASQVTAGTDAGDVAATATGTIDVPSAGVTATAAVSSGVEASTTYVVWVHCVDAIVPANEMAAPTSTSVTTLPDTTAPVFATGYPRATGVTTSAMTLEAVMDEAGTAHFVVLATSASVPNAAQIKAGTDGADGAPIASGSLSVSSTGGGFAGSSTVSSGLVAGDTYARRLLLTRGLVLTAGGLYLAGIEWLWLPMMQWHRQRKQV